MYSTVFNTGEKVTNTNNFTNIQKILNRFWTCLFGPGEVIRKNTGEEKSRDTVPLRKRGTTGRGMLGEIEGREA